VTAAELMEQGIRAYTRCELGEAERCWRDVVALEPTNARALSYLELLVGKLAPQGAPGKDGGSAASIGLVTTAGAAPVPLPPPAAVPAAAPAPSRGRGAEPVPLPAPEEGAWMRPPIAIPPAPEPSSIDGRELRERTTLSDYAPSPWDQGPAMSPAVVLDDGDGLDLASVAEQSDLRALVPEEGDGTPQTPRRKPRSEVEIWMEGARELFALGDFSGSLEMIEKILKIESSHVEAREYLRQNEATLIAMYESKIGPPRAIPRLAIKPEEVMWLNLDHRAGFLLAQIDGTVSYDDLFALSGLPHLDTARILAALLQEGVIRS
jgi:hypothetical protein